MAAFVKRPYQIVSEMNGKALDIKGGAGHPGAEVIMWNRKLDRSANQLWYNDHTGCIRSMLNDMALECGAQGQHFCMSPYNGAPRQQWTWSGNRIINRMVPGECLDIEREEQRDGARVVAWAYKGSPNQHWRQQFI